MQSAPAASQRALEHVAGVLGEREQHAADRRSSSPSLGERGGQRGGRAAAADEIDTAELGLRRLGRRGADDGDAALRGQRRAAASAANASTPRRDVNTSQSALGTAAASAARAPGVDDRLAANARQRDEPRRRAREPLGPLGAVFLAARQQDAAARRAGGVRAVIGRAASSLAQAAAPSVAGSVPRTRAVRTTPARSCIASARAGRRPAKQYAPNATSQPPSARASASRSAVTAARLGA